MLLKIVAAYYVLVQLIPMVILGPIFQGNHYNWLFREQDQGSLNNAGGWYGKHRFRCVITCTATDLPKSCLQLRLRLLQCRILSAGRVNDPFPAVLCVCRFSSTL